MKWLGFIDERLILFFGILFLFVIFKTIDILLAKVFDKLFKNNPNNKIKIVKHDIWLENIEKRLDSIEQRLERIENLFLSRFKQ